MNLPEADALPKGVAFRTELKFSRIVLYRARQSRAERSLPLTWERFRTNLAGSQALGTPFTYEPFPGSLGASLIQTVVYEDKAGVGDGVG